METTLIEVRDEASASLVRTAVRAAAATAGLDARRLELLVAAASELAFNQLHHAHLGQIEIAGVEIGEARGVEVVASDRGPGLDDAPAAFAGRLTGKGLGVGLAAVRRVADELDVDVRHLEGTCIAVRVWANPPRPRPELVMEGRPYPGEPRSGDDGLFVRTRTGFVAAVIDGLGHGAAARVASSRASDCVRENLHLPLPELLRHTHEAVRGTRGCAMTVVRHRTDSGELMVCGIGNIETMVLTRRGERIGHVPQAGTVGVRRHASPPRCHTWELLGGDVLIMATDGLPRRTNVASIPGLASHAPTWIAHHLIAEHARSTDDALVLVAK